MTGAVAVLTYASVCVLLRCTERTGKLTYAALMEAECARWAGVAVRLSIILGSAGFLVLYLIILADLLVGGRGRWAGGWVCGWVGGCAAGVSLGSSKPGS